METAMLPVVVYDIFAAAVQPIVLLHVRAGFAKPGSSRVRAGPGDDIDASLCRDWLPKRHNGVKHRHTRYSYNHKSRLLLMAPVTIKDLFSVDGQRIPSRTTVHSYLGR